MAIVTVGHGRLARTELGALLTGAGVSLLVDVRRTPGSRRHPQVNRGELERWVPELGIAYRWEETLGGRRDPDPGSPNVALADAAFRGYADHMAGDAFRTSLAAVAGEARDRTVAVMCAEADPRRCHRRLLADALVLLLRVEVAHLDHEGRRRPHEPDPAARREGERVVYDRGAAQPGLFEA